MSQQGGPGAANAPEYIGSYKLGKAIGSGSFCQVRLGVHIPTSRKVAIKIMSRKRQKKQNMLEKVRSEIHIQRMFNHPHIIRILEVIDTSTEICLVMEYVNGGEQFDYIVARGRLSETESRGISQQLVSALRYTHAHSVVHRDLKPENLLLSIPEDNSGGVPLQKQADFGLSAQMRDGFFLSTSCGSPNYAAPEVISASPYAGPEVDVWSLGVIQYACLCGVLPFDHENIRVLFRKIKSGQYDIPGYISLPARDLQQRMQQVDPIRRISLGDIVKHAWFRVGLPLYLWLSAPEFEREAEEVDARTVSEMCAQYGYVPSVIYNALSYGAELCTSRRYRLEVEARQVVIVYKLTSGDTSLDRFTEIAKKKIDFASRILHTTIDNPIVLDFVTQSEFSEFRVLQNLEDHRTVANIPILVIPGRWVVGMWSSQSAFLTVTVLLQVLKAYNYVWKMQTPYSIKAVYKGSGVDGGNNGNPNLDPTLNEYREKQMNDTDGTHNTSMPDIQSTSASPNANVNNLFETHTSNVDSDVVPGTLALNTSHTSKIQVLTDAATMKETSLRLHITIYNNGRDQHIVDIRKVSGHQVLFLQHCLWLFGSFKPMLSHLSHLQSINHPNSTNSAATSPNPTNSSEMENVTHSTNPHTSTNEEIRQQNTSTSEHMTNSTDAVSHTNIPLDEATILSQAQAIGVTQAHITYIQEYFSQNPNLPIQLKNPLLILQHIINLPVNERSMCLQNATYLGEVIKYYLHQVISANANALNISPQQTTQIPPTTTSTTIPATTNQHITTESTIPSTNTTTATTTANATDTTKLLTDLSPDELQRYYNHCHGLYVRHYNRYCTMVQEAEAGKPVDYNALRTLHDQLREQANALTQMRQLPNMPKG